MSVKTYILENGIQVNAPENEINNFIEKLGLSEAEAVQMYADDHGITKNAAQDELDAFAKANKPKQQTPRKKSTTKRPPKQDTEKEGLIKNIADYVQTVDGIADVTITNKTKLISFRMGDADYEINLIRKRPPKNK